jgi:hypothetical protein
MCNASGDSRIIGAKVCWNPYRKGKSMNRKILGIIGLGSFALMLVLSTAWQAPAQDAKSPYPTSMAPLDQYLMDRNAEIALARSAAPPSIARDATVMVLGKDGYETAVKGTNGFVCIVDRSWTDKQDEPEFWNSRRRGAMCLNAAGARSILPNTFLRTKLALAGQSKDQIFEALQAAFDKKELPEVEPGAMCYMMSKQSHLSDRDGRWHPHLMFFVAPDPIFGDNAGDNRFVVFAVKVAKWSDGTPDTDGQ